MIRPEEKVDNRTLYERLKSNADKKQEEHDEKFSLSKLFTATSVTPRTQTPLSSFFLCLSLPIFSLLLCTTHTLYQAHMFAVPITFALCGHPTD